MCSTQNDWRVVTISMLTCYYFALSWGHCHLLILLIVGNGFLPNSTYKGKVSVLYVALVLFLPKKGLGTRIASWMLTVYYATRPPKLTSMGLKSSSDGVSFPLLCLLMGLNSSSDGVSFLLLCLLMGLKSSSDGVSFLLLCLLMGLKSSSDDKRF